MSFFFVLDVSMLLKAVVMVASIIEVRRSKLVLIACWRGIVRGGSLSPISSGGFVSACDARMSVAVVSAVWSGAKSTSLDALWSSRMMFVYGSLLLVWM